MSEETKIKISEARKGMTFSDEHKRSLRIAMNNPETRRKFTESMKGRRWWTDGINNIRAEICPEGFHKNNNLQE